MQAGKERQATASQLIEGSKKLARESVEAPITGKIIRVGLRWVILSKG